MRSLVFIIGHLIFKLHYDKIYQVKTTKNKLHLKSASHYFFKNRYLVGNKNCVLEKQILYVLYE